MLASYIGCQFFLRPVRYERTAQTRRTVPRFVSGSPAFPFRLRAITMRPIIIRAITPSDHSTRYLSLRAPFDAATQRCYDRNAGWSSLVARWAHNPKVGGSNPPPATNAIIRLRAIGHLHRLSKTVQ